MVFARLTLSTFAGNRRNDPKEERRRSQMAAARQILERSTLVLLVSSKTSLRHMDCNHAKENRDTVFCQMRRAMDLIHYVIKDSICAVSQNDRQNRHPNTMDWDTDRGTASSCLRVFARLMESSRPRFSASGTSILSSSKTTLKDISSTGKRLQIYLNHSALLFFSLTQVVRLTHCMARRTKAAN